MGRLRGRLTAALSGCLMGACIAASAEAAPSRAPLTGYIVQPVEQLGLPGDPASGEITPEGDVYTGWSEYELSVGSRLRSWAQRTRILPRPSVPLLLSRLERDGVGYTQRVFTVPVDGQPVTYVALTAHNAGPRRRTGRAALQLEYTRDREITGFHQIRTGQFRFERPAPGFGDGYFFQLGQNFDPAWRYTIAGRDVTRDGLLLVRGPAGGTTLPTPESRLPDAPHARRAYERALAPGASVTWVWQIPLCPPTATAELERSLRAVSLTAAEARLDGLWRTQERGMAQIDVPEARVNAVYAANVVQMLQSRYRTPSGWVQAVNRLQYQAYWIRDSAIETVALDQVGLHAATAQDLAFLSHWQQPDGLYISRAGQQDGIGQALWELDQHAQLTHSPGYAATQMPNVTAAVNWIDHAIRGDSLGLLPPSSVRDDEFLAASHITGDNVWAAVGLRSAVALARLAGQPQLADAWQGIDDRFEQALRSALAAADARAGHVTPGLDGPGGFDWGNYWIAYPLPILTPSSSAVQATLRWAQAHSREGLATYANGALLHDYLGFPLDETELRDGQTAAALAGFYSELVHTTAPGYGWEDGPTPYGGRQTTTNLSPHGTFSGQFVTMLRSLLVRDDGDGIDLLSGVSPAWMAPGDRTTVLRAPTRYGTISFTVTVARSGNGATLRWSRSRGSTGPLRWALPFWARPRRSLRLAGRQGSLTARWSGRRPHLSAAQAAAALNRSYLSRGKPAPIAPARGW